MQAVFFIVKEVESKLCINFSCAVVQRLYRGNKNSVGYIFTMSSVHFHWCDRFTPMSEILHAFKPFLVASY